MAGGSWKVAYADFMTAMMAFFLLMWLLNATTEEQRVGLAEYFTPGANGTSSSISPIDYKGGAFLYKDKLDTRQFSMKDVQDSHYAIFQALKKELEKDAQASKASGVTSNQFGVLMHLTANLVFEPNSLDISPEGEKILDQVVAIMEKYKVYLIVRGHADSNETSTPRFPSKWELSAARANAAVRYLIAKGVNARYLRSIAYADTSPRVPSGLPNSFEENSRVEFNFHRPEVMSTLGSY